MTIQPNSTMAKANMNDQLPPNSATLLLALTEDAEPRWMHRVRASKVGKSFCAMGLPVPSHSKSSAFDLGIFR